MGKVIAAFPDVCMSPPSPPAGPIPIPYPNTSFSSDLKEGSQTVTLGGRPAALSQQSYYQPSALGNEAATKAWGMAVVTHTITGKTYFQAWSSDVLIEGKNACRHTDITTCNHASAPGSTPPNPNLEAMALGKIEDDSKQCACCKGPRHSAGNPMTMDDWYTKDSSGKEAPHAQEYRDLMKDVAIRTCDPVDPCKYPTKVIPSPPCNVFRRPVTEKKQIAAAWKGRRSKYQGDHGIPDIATVTAALISERKKKSDNRPVTQNDVEEERKVNHLVPKEAAGGCPVGDGNLQSNGHLCSRCRALDHRFTVLQGKAANA
jgi:uncharacterized Zn-binding protein involved in type VI secretion